MHPIFSPKRVEKYFKIYQQIYETPTITLQEITNQTSISKNTVAKYLEIMYNHKIIRGPWLSLNPADNYSQYVYFLNFENPFQTILTLKEREHVVYVGAFFGKWNIMIITDAEIDFTPIPGYEDVYFSGKKGFVITPKVSYMTWDKSFTEIDEKINQFKPDQNAVSQHERTLLWGPREFQIFNMLKDNVRQKISPLLKREKVPYEDYKPWRETLEDYCTVHTEFYRNGFDAYMHYWFFFLTDYEEYVKSLFSLLPTTCTIIPVGNRLIVNVNADTSEAIKRLLIIVLLLESKGIIKKLNYSNPLSEYHCNFTGCKE